MVEGFDEDIKRIKESNRKEIDAIRNFLSKNKLLIFLLTPKMGGKTTYINYMKGLFPNEFDTVSAGDIVRKVQKGEEGELLEKLKGVFGDKAREALSKIKESNVKNLVADEVIAKLLESEALSSSKSIFIDGFPRTEKQILYALKIAKGLKEQGYTPLALNIRIADDILDQRLEGRRVCKKCGMVGNLLTLHSSSVGYDKNSETFFIRCDNCGIKLEKKSTDTSISEMLGRRNREKEVFKRLVKEFKRKGFKLIDIRSDIQTGLFNGKNEDLNLIAKYSVDKNNNVSIERKRQIGKTKEGLEVYSYHPRKVTALIIQKLSAVLNS